jgi:hypothetical protein
LLSVVIAGTLRRVGESHGHPGSAKTEDDTLPLRVDAVDLKTTCDNENRLSWLADWLLKIVRALTVPDPWHHAGEGPRSIKGDIAISMLTGVHR